MTIQPGQIYRSCKPGYEEFRIRITSVGTETVSATSVDGGWALLNPVPIRQLHATPTTKTGQPRRSGYVLETGDTR
ncbi:hypothetical protein ABZ135_38770 [Streptomyces sp. NPDC006339]|uniref:hypothetical protein n=1 Tax=Streptomyces sp. NPDC006339 TaxID=3156755 RepID=UPI0033A7C246